MITTITQYHEYPREGENQPLPVGNLTGTNTSLTATGNVTLGSETYFVRIATDTAVHLNIGATATSSHPYLPAGAVEFFAVKPSQVLYVTSA